jgi:ABC-2 type transport system permease protein
MLIRTLSLIKKELIQVFRDPLTLRMTLVMPIIQLIVFGFVVNTDVENVPSAILDYDNSAASRELRQKFESSGYFTFDYILEDEAEADVLLDRGDIDIALIIPEDFQRHLRTGKKAEVLALINGTDSNTSTTVGSYASGITARFAQNTLLRQMSLPSGSLQLAIDARPRLLFNPEAKSSTFVIPGIIAVLLAMLLILLSGISIVRERERGTLEQLSVTPLSATEMVIGKTLPFLILGTVMIVFLSPLGTIIFDVPFEGSVIVLLFTNLIYMLSLVGFGLLIGSGTETQQQTLMLSMFVIMPQILLSGFVFPIESMPEVLQWLTYIIPARYFLTIIRSIFLKGLGFEYFLFELGMLTFLSLTVYAISVRSFRKSLG